jgi:hypothetical protein
VAAVLVAWQVFPGADDGADDVEVPVVRPNGHMGRLVA